MPLEVAMDIIVSESGKAFDPRVVAALKARYVELEKLAKAQPPEARPKLSLDIKVTRGAAPGAGFAVSEPSAELPQPASNQVEITGRSAGAQALEETFSAAALRLHRLVSFDAFAVFTVRGDTLQTCFALGENVRQLWSLQIRVGEGLVGWVAETGHHIINGNPTVDHEHEESETSIALNSALAIPLVHNGRTVGVLAAYGLQAGFFKAEHLSAFQASCPQLAEILATPPDWAARKNSVHRSADGTRPERHAVLM
jgi:GAF domain-containing protein